ncbi:hypothetical protein CUJ88_13770 [Paraburkholderia hospita]|nr:hypothetical protein CUJ88_13770 [Paraburkholderia hospita]
MATLPRIDVGAARPGETDETRARCQLRGARPVSCTAARWIAPAVILPMPLSQTVTMLLARHASSRLRARVQSGLT